MKNTRWCSKSRRHDVAARTLRCYASRRGIETNGVLLLIAAAEHAEKGERESAIADMERYELVADSLTQSDRAVLQSIKANLKGERFSDLKMLVFRLIGGALFGQLFALLRQLIESRPQIYQTELGDAVTPSNSGRPRTLVRNVVGRSV